jgi:hypothetical protein
LVTEVRAAMSAIMRMPPPGSNQHSSRPQSDRRKSKFLAALCLTLLAVPAACVVAADAGPSPIFYVPFDDTSVAKIARGEPKPMTGCNKYEPGVVGKAGVTSGRTIARWEGRGNIDLDRGTLAMFFKPGTEVRNHVFGGIALGVDTNIQGYWSMVLLWNMLGEQFCFDLYDVGRFGERLQLEPNVGRWKTGEWVHLAAVWDRNEGIKVYENGKLVASNWGKHHWDWNNDPTTLWAGGSASIDELYVFSDCLTDEQVTQLSKGQAPTGQPLPITPPAQRRAADLARMGWAEADLAQIPSLDSGGALRFTFARFVSASDDGRLEARPFEGLKATAWPNPRIGVQLGRKERRLDMTLAPGQSFDRVRIFAQRPFEGEIVKVVPDIGNKVIANVKADRPVWRASLPAKLTEEKLSLLRHAGWIGQVDLFTAEPVGALPAAGELQPLGDLAKLDRLAPTDAGKAILDETPVRFDFPVRATTQPADAWTLLAPPFGGFQIISEPLAEQGAYDGALIRLVAETMDGPTPVRVVVKEPVFTQRDWMVADVILRPKGTGRQTFTLLLKARPVLNTKGIELPVTVTAGNPVTWAMGKGGTEISLCTTDMATARPIAVDDQVEFAREDYGETSEGRGTIWGLPPAFWLRGYTPLAWLRDYAPDDRRAMQLLFRLGWRKEPLPFAEPENKTGAPDWAFWQWKAMNESRRIKYWWIDHRQSSCGEFGHTLGDDTDMVENWVDAALCYDGDDQKIKNALRLLYGAAWTAMDNGASRTIRDTLHSYEEGCGTIAQHLFIDYGDPIAFERCMASSSHLEKWTKVNPDGTISFRSVMLGAPGVWEYGKFATDAPINSLLLIPAAFQMWYSGHATAARYVTKWQLIDNRTSGMVYDAYARTLAPDARQKWLQDQLAAALENPRAFELANVLGDMPAIPDAVKNKVQDKVRRYYGDNQLMHFYKMDPDPWNALVNSDTQWLAYAATGDTAYLADSYRQVCMFINNGDWLHTSGQTNGDRCPLPRMTLARARMGGSASHRAGNANWWPRHAVSYVLGATETAALITENTDTKLAVRFFAFTDGPHKVQARLWRLDPGTYQLALAHDKNNDGVPEGVIEERKIEVVRGSSLDLTLPPKQGVVLSLTGIKTAPMNFDRPDPAISPDTIALDYGEHLQVTVHNLGNKPVENLLVRISSARGNILFEKRIPHIDAPLDFKPKTAMIELQNVNAVTDGRVIVELDPNHEIDDLNRFNNRVVFKY